MREFISFTPIDSCFGVKLIQYIKSIPNGIILNTCDDTSFNQSFVKSKYRLIAGFGEMKRFEGSKYSDLAAFQKKINDWMLGFISYDFKNQLEALHSSNDDHLQMPELFFFQPEYLIVNDDKGWQIGFDSKMSNIDCAKQLVREIDNLKVTQLKIESGIDIFPKVTKDDYIKNVLSIKDHIHRGDIYEINYCIEFYNNNAVVDPYLLYLNLINESPVPFAAFVKVHNKFLMSASPERYLKKERDKIFSQPIKGTIKRGGDSFEDQEQLRNLQMSIKDRSENIMIADLVRNDLSKIAQKGSVKVEELCGIYSFKHLYQMISTISATLQPTKSWIDTITSTFPMGSMTGAPKFKAMQLIEEYEVTKRGLYSGAVGYITPDKDFDFNVVIRSLLYNQSKHYLSFMVGSAITSLSDPDEEYEECLLKAKAIKKVLEFNSKD